MKKIVAPCIFLFAFIVGSAFAQQPKVVVIPLNTSKQVIVNGGYDSTSLLTDSVTYIMSGTDVSLPVDGTCVVTATGFVRNLDNGDTVKGPYLRTARQTGAGSPAADQAFGGYAIYITGSDDSTTVAVTNAWNMTADTVYRFGCAHLFRPANWADDLGTCRVTWVCTAN